MAANFKFKKVDRQDVELMEKVYRIRYQVYCLESGFLNPSDYPDEMESDEYDPYSIHFIAIHGQNPIGTVRLIKKSDLSFPLEDHCNIKATNCAIVRSKLVEISRLAISKTFRKRTEDGLYGIESYLTVAEGGILPLSPTPEEAAKHSRRRRPEIVLGLYRQMFQESKRLGINFWYAAMEKKLERLLKKFQFAFDQIGEPVDYYGPVIPYLGKLDKIERSVAAAKPEMYKFFVEGLEKKYLQNK